MAVSRKTLKKLRGQRQKATRKGYVTKGTHISKKGVVIKNRGRQTGTRGIGSSKSPATPPTGNVSGKPTPRRSAPTNGTTAAPTSHVGVASAVESYVRSTVGDVMTAMRKKYQGTPASSAAVTAAFKKRYGR